LSVAHNASRFVPIWLIRDQGQIGNSLLLNPLVLEELMKMSIVDTIDLLYSMYATGVFAFIAYFAYKLTKPKPK